VHPRQCQAVKLTEQEAPRGNGDKVRANVVFPAPFGPAMMMQRGVCKGDDALMTDCS
jgi:hypothetical protein